MKGVISTYRRSRHVVNGNQLVVLVEGIESKEAAQKLLGKKVTWNSGKRALHGEVVGAHGNKGAVKVKFETGMPGQALGQEVQVN